jgi:hypothetical protein
MKSRTFGVSCRADSSGTLDGPGPELTRALVIVNLRDTTFEAHREEPPLDAFINAVNFYIRSPRFALMIRKRLELVMN